jgi:hypothetical protein
VLFTGDTGRDRNFRADLGDRCKDDVGAVPDPLG